jgi:hypothetical protein
MTVTRIKKANTLGCHPRRALTSESAPAMAGHLYAFGSTAEMRRVEVRGCRGRGTKDDPPVDHYHYTGHRSGVRGGSWVAVHRGAYFDAIYNQGPGKENTPGVFSVYFVSHVFVLCFVLYLCFWHRPPETVATAASAMAPRVLAVHLALAYAQCLTLSSIM